MSHPSIDSQWTSQGIEAALKSLIHVWLHGRQSGWHVRVLADFPNADLSDVD